MINFINNDFKKHVLEIKEASNLIEFYLANLEGNNISYTLSNRKKEDYDERNHSSLTFIYKKGNFSIQSNGGRSLSLNMSFDIGSAHFLRRFIIFYKETFALMMNNEMLKILDREIELFSVVLCDGFYFTNNTLIQSTEISKTEDWMIVKIKQNHITQTIPVPISSFNKYKCYPYSDLYRIYSYIEEYLLLNADKDDEVTNKDDIRKEFSNFGITVAKTIYIED
jgi:hypothetical protein